MEYSITQRPEFISTQEFAELAQVTDVTIRRWRKSGYGPAATRVGPRYLYSTEQVFAFLRGGAR